MTRSQWWESLGLVALFLALGASWAMVSPAAEPPDEAFHVMYAAHVARTGELPVTRPPERLDVPVEGNQPPLYYIVGAGVLRLAGMGSLEFGPPPRNPRSHKVGGPEASVYDHLDSGFGWSEVERATRLLRLTFLPLGALVVFFTYWAASRVPDAPETWPLLAAGFIATLPQFTFIMGAVTNDALANALGAGALAWMVFLVARGEMRAKDVVGLGIVLGVGLWTKMTLVFLIPAALTAVMLAAGRLQRGIRLGALLTFVVLGVGGGMFLRFYLLYGDPFGISVIKVMFPSLMHEPTLAYWLQVFPQALMYSFWGVFGHASIHLGKLYAVFLVEFLAMAAGLGLAWRRGVLRGPSLRVFGLLTVAILFVFASIVRFNLTFSQPQGRYWFPGMLALGLMFGYGFTQFLGKRWMALTLVVILALLNQGVLWLAVAPAY